MADQDKAQFNAAIRIKGLPVSVGVIFKEEDDWVYRPKDPKTIPESFRDATVFDTDSNREYRIATLTYRLANPPQDIRFNLENLSAGK